MRHCLLWLVSPLENILPFQNAKHKCDIIYWGYFMLERIPPFQMQCTMQHYLLGYMNAHENTSLSKCKVQILHYLLELFFVLENTHLPLFEMQSTNATLFNGVNLWLTEYPPFQNAKYKCDIMYWVYCLL